VARLRGPLDRHRRVARRAPRAARPPGPVSGIPERSLVAQPIGCGP
jgi:hypothetical protein